VRAYLQGRSGFESASVLSQTTHKKRTATLQRGDPSTSSKRSTMITPLVRDDQASLITHATMMPKGKKGRSSVKSFNEKFDKTKARLENSFSIEEFDKPSEAETGSVLVTLNHGNFAQLQLEYHDGGEEEEDDDAKYIFRLSQPSLELFGPVMEINGERVQSIEFTILSSFHIVSFVDVMRRFVEWADQRPDLIENRWTRE